MNIKLTTEQRNELLARYVFAVENYLYWNEAIHSEYDEDVKAQIKKWRGRLVELSALTKKENYQSLKEIIDELSNN